ncbi:hypothetical protein AB7645_12955 [Bradyrhizobium sp. 956_D2_N1_5]|jgi:hypothetical protein|uniref:hypothetical protein n=1 Tax=unclassified Bradyrhizobium TaxID=2631580 RepID=UPI003F21AE87
MELLRDCDLVPAAGSGYFTESFAPHARRVLDTPAAGLRRGKPAAILSCGFEAVRGRALAERMLSVLPKLGRIVCREPPQSPDVLRSFGVPTDRMVIAGDGAIEFALARRPEVLGRGLASTCVAPTMPASGLPQSPTGARCCAARSLIWTR